MTHFRATVAYDGSAFLGFQRQAQGRTVQGTLEEALSRLVGNNPVRVRGAGRTDSGVHATGQVVDFHLPAWRHGETTLHRALNATLPEDVAVRALQPAPPGFDPRRSARSRAYVYTVLNSPVRQPLLHRTTLHIPQPLDAEAMGAAVCHLLGEHDFASFGRATTESGSTTRTLLAADVWRQDEQVRVGLEANGFLYRMVRSIIGALLPIGRGEQPPEWMGTVLAARDRSWAVPVAPNGLCLVAVRYSNEMATA